MSTKNSLWPDTAKESAEISSIISLQDEL